MCICITWKQVVTALNLVATCGNQSTDYLRKERALLHLPAELEEGSLLRPRNLSLRTQGHLQAHYNKWRRTFQRGVHLNALRSRGRWCIWDTTVLLVLKSEDIGVPQQTHHHQQTLPHKPSPVSHPVSTAYGQGEEHGGDTSKKHLWLRVTMTMT